MDAALALQTRLRADLKAAMQARRSAEVKLLRVLIGAIDNAQAVPLAADSKPAESASFADGAAEVPRKTLSVAELDAVLIREQQWREAAAQTMANHGRDAEADELRAEATLIASYESGKAD